MGKTTLWRAAVEHADASRACACCRRSPPRARRRCRSPGSATCSIRCWTRRWSRCPPRSGERSPARWCSTTTRDRRPIAHAVGVACMNALRGLRPSDRSSSRSTTSSGSTRRLPGRSAYAARRFRERAHRACCSRGASGLESSLLDEIRALALGERSRGSRSGRSTSVRSHQSCTSSSGRHAPAPAARRGASGVGRQPVLRARDRSHAAKRSATSVEAGQPLPVPESLHDLVHGRLLALPAESRDFLLAAAAHAHPTDAVDGGGIRSRPRRGPRPLLSRRASSSSTATGSASRIRSSPRVRTRSRTRFAVRDPCSAGRASRGSRGAGVAAGSVRRRARRGRRGRPGGRCTARTGARSAATRRAAARSRAGADARRSGRRRATAERSTPHTCTSSRGTLRGRRHSCASRDRGARRTAHGGLGRSCAWRACARTRRRPRRPTSSAGGRRGRGRSRDCSRSRTRAWPRVSSGSASGSRRRVEHAERRAAIALELGDEALAAEALAARSSLGRACSGPRRERDGRAARSALQDAAEGPASPRTAARHARGALGVDRSARAVRGSVRRHAASARASLATRARGRTCCSARQASASSVQLESARARAGEGRSAAEQSGQDTLFGVQSGARGRSPRAARPRRDAPGPAAQRALELVAADCVPARRARGAAGARPSRAARSAHRTPRCHTSRPAVEFVRREGIGEPGAIRFVVDQIEALDRARPARRGGRAPRLVRGECPSARAGIGARQLRTLSWALAAQAGRLEEALRRTRKRSSGMRRVERAARPWAHAARARCGSAPAEAPARGEGDARGGARRSSSASELHCGQSGHAPSCKRISGRAATPGALTPAEERVAALVAEGKTNREVAAALFLSDRTVEGHLSHVFGKLGISHRTELARRSPRIKHRGSPRQTRGIRPFQPRPSRLSLGSGGHEGHQEQKEKER